MDNRIQKNFVWDSRLDPAEAEVALAVYPQQLTSTTQVRGRLIGPRCRYASTVEVAYPLRETSRQYEAEGTPHLTMRVVIPEASFWDPESPFLYEGPVELWQEGQLCDQVRLRHGLRSVKLGPRGLRWNGRLLTLQGAVPSGASEEELLRLHETGYNTLLISVGPATANVWDRADRLGFLMLGRITDKAGVGQAFDLGNHVCCLGWVLDPRLLEDEVVAAVMPGFLAEQDQLVGLEAKDRPSGSLPEGWHFVLCEERLLPGLSGIHLPKVVLRDPALTRAAEPKDDLSAGILGWIDR